MSNVLVTLGVVVARHLAVHYGERRAAPLATRSSQRYRRLLCAQFVSKKGTRSWHNSGHQYRFHVVDGSHAVGYYLANWVANVSQVSRSFMPSFVNFRAICRRDSFCATSVFYYSLPVLLRFVEELVLRILEQTTRCKTDLTYATSVSLKAQCTTQLRCGVRWRQKRKWVKCLVIERKRKPWFFKSLKY